MSSMACLSSNLSHGELVLLSSSSSTSRSLSMTAFNAALLLRARCSHFCRTPCRRVHRSSQPVSELALAKAGSTWFWITVHASMSLPMRLVMKSARQRNSPQRGMLLDRLCVLAASASNLCCIIFSTAFFMVASFRNASSSAPKWPRSGRSVAKSTSCWASSCDSRSPETLCRSHREAVSVFDRFAARSPPGLPARPRPQSKNLHVSTSLQYGASRGQKSGNEAGLMSQKWMAPTTCGTSSIALSSAVSRQFLSSQERATSRTCNSCSMTRNLERSSSIVVANGKSKSAPRLLSSVKCWQHRAKANASRSWMKRRWPSTRSSG
mmetsp:Transcript_98289/g.194736  ORF Transcript_98289/g.194736 Transcript_98289/m.194736 type:complete len:323 (-) Transcript_98289:414-1382(-)